MSRPSVNHCCNRGQFSISQPSNADRNLKRSHFALH